MSKNKYYAVNNEMTLEVLFDYVNAYDLQFLLAKKLKAVAYFILIGLDSRVAACSHFFYDYAV